jgi:hypothetical protein
MICARCPCTYGSKTSLGAQTASRPLRSSAARLVLIC